jgi:tRNA-modifying protein YgfZ
VSAHVTPEPVFGPGDAMAGLHDEAGAVWTELNGVRTPRHYGDPVREYEAAVDGGSIFDRSHRALIPVEGRAPAQMLTGIVSGRMPAEPVAAGEGVVRGEAQPSTVLTPKGKLVTELRLFRLEAGPEGALLLDLPRAGLDGLIDHMKTYLPPRMARLVPPPEPLGMLTLTGHQVAAILTREALGLRVDTPDLAALSEGEERVLDDGSRTGVRVVRSGDVHPMAFDLIGAAAVVRSLWVRLVSLGFTPAGHGVWETLRIERGRPAYGVELDLDVLPPEAGLQERMIDHHKGCYTGQEVIVRVRDRGRVNRHLRGLLLGDLPTPATGTLLFIEGRERAAGEVRSTAQSPRLGQGIALGFVRREVEPPGVVRLGSPDGPEIGVRALGDDGWELVEGDVRRTAAVR